MFESIKHSQCQIEDKHQNSAKDYVRTSDEQKLELVDLVMNEKYSMKLASQIVGVKLSTVKYIIKAYKTDKQYFMGKLKPKKVRIERQKTKQEVKNQPLTNFDSSPKNSEPKDLSLSEANTLKIDNGNNTQLAPSQAQFFPAFQNFCQLNTFWNHYMSCNNNWIYPYFGN